ncbi:MAG: hypothetical protein EXR72_12265 [Myxococcales bacterium]|nr:hypothetical protein [Myxococcales bacterium]
MRPPVAVVALAIALIAPHSSRADTAAPEKFEIEANALKVPGPVLFETASDKIKPESERAEARQGLPRREGLHLAPADRGSHRRAGR